MYSPLALPGHLPYFEPAARTIVEVDYCELTYA